MRARGHILVVWCIDIVFEEESEGGKKYKGEQMEKKGDKKQLILCL